jgi:myosin heavy subunit
LLNAFNTINLSNDNQDCLFKLLAGILHLGNIYFNEFNNYACLQNDTGNFFKKKHCYILIILIYYF